MYDTVHLKLTAQQAGGVSFLDDTPACLERVGYHDYSGEPVITGRLGNLTVSANQYQLKVRDGSLCRWYLGSNFKSLTRGDVQRAVEALSDTLHLPMASAVVTRVDVACNFILKAPVSVYLNHLGEMRGVQRLQQPDSLYYQSKSTKLHFYDKCREQRARGEPIPDLYKGRSVLRYERRFEHRLQAMFGREITGATLFEEAFYMDAIGKWYEAYKAVSKINEVTINFEAMTTKKQFYKMAALSMIERFGGELAFLNHIAEAQKQGTLTAKQAFDLRRAVHDVCQSGDGLTVPSEAISELDKKMREAVRYYR